MIEIDGVKLQVILTLGVRVGLGLLLGVTVGVLDGDALLDGEIETLGVFV